MGLLADFYVSTEADALAYDKSQSVSDPEDLAQYKSLTEIPLSTLWAMLQGIEWSLEMIDEFEEIFSRDNWEVVIKRLPAEFVARLSELYTGSLDEIVSAWAQTEELAADRWAEDDVRLLLNDLIRLARRARATGRNVYFWNSL